jgi:hypothetical protein
LHVGPSINKQFNQVYSVYFTTKRSSYPLSPAESLLARIYRA